MTDATPGETRPELEKADPPSASAPDLSSTQPPEPVKELTPEEQMALYEKDLKENDWGHQPC